MWSPTYVAYITARFLCVLSMQTLMLVLALSLYDLTRNPFYLGVAGLMIFLPALTLVLVSGLVVDRLNRRAILVICFAIIASCALALALLQSQGELTPVRILVIMAIMGTARAFYNPTLKALLVNVVPVEAVPRAVALNTTLAKTAAILGPVLGGLLYAVDPLYAFIGAAVSLVLALLAATRIRRTSQERVTRPATAADLIGGFQAILGNRVLFAAMTLDLCAVLLGGATALLPIYAHEILFVGAAETGILRAAPAAGTLMAALLLVWRPLNRNAGRIMLQATFCYGLCILLFGLSTSFALSLLALAGAGAADMISIFVREILIQLKTPDVMRGRVSAINGVFNSGANELGDFRAGTSAVLIGTVPAVIVGALLSMGVAVLWGLRFPELRQSHLFGLDTRNKADKQPPSGD